MTDLTDLTTYYWYGFTVLVDPDLSPGTIIVGCDPIDAKLISEQEGLDE